MSKITNIRRLQNEVRRIDEQRETYKNMFHLKMIDDNMYHWNAELYGPEDSLYEAKQFNLDIQLPSDYPFSPPRVKFITPIEHVNINKNGDICLDILKPEYWAASQNIITVMISIRVLMSNPNPDDPFNSELAALYRTNHDEYVSRIKSSCEKVKKIQN